MFKETPKEFFKEKERALSGKPILKTEKTDTMSNSEEVNEVLEQHKNLMTRFGHDENISEQEIKDVINLANLATKIAEGKDKTEMAKLASHWTMMKNDLFSKKKK
jgi:hypothetical protein